jgi:hypothetical protein
MSLSSFSSLGQFMERRSGSGAAPAAGLNTISSTSLVYYYPFESADVSGSTCQNKITGGTFDLTLVGAPVQTSVFRNGAGALETSVSKYANLTTATNFFSTTQSFCFKFRVTAINGFIQLINTLSGTSGTSHNCFVQIYNNTAPYILRVVLFVPSYAEIAISSSIAANTWYSVAVVKNGTNIQTYLNGSATGSYTGGINYLLTTNQVNRLFIGNDIQSPSHFMNGAMDDFRIYNRAISAAEVLALHNSTV